MTPTGDEWAERYGSQNTPWDLGRAHPELVAWLGEDDSGGSGAGRRALVPGCGTGFDALALARAGYAVTALDLVEGAPLESHRRELEAGGGQVLSGDALAFDEQGGFDLVWEHTFFCAIEPELRRDWGRLLGRSLRVGGELAALVFPVDRAGELGGPPFGYGPADLLGTLDFEFELLEERPVALPVKKRQWQERWLRLRRLS